MGREIRRVPPNWEHPKYKEIKFAWQKGAYHPLRDKDYDTACQEWYAEAASFKPNEYCKWYHEWNGNPPNEEYYRKEKWTPEEASWYQIYETVSEGTPVTPAFSSKEELIEYLVQYGDFWDQKENRGGWSRKNAENFVKDEYAPSIIVANGKVMMPRDQNSE